MTEEVKTTYTALDGRSFIIKSDCVKYEQELLEDVGKVVYEVVINHSFDITPNYEVFAITSTYSEAVRLVSTLKATNKYLSGVYFSISQVKLFNMSQLSEVKNKCPLGEKVDYYHILAHTEGFTKCL